MGESFTGLTYNLDELCVATSANQLSTFHAFHNEGPVDLSQSPRPPWQRFLPQGLLMVAERFVGEAHAVSLRSGFRQEEQVRQTLRALGYVLEATRARWRRDAFYFNIPSETALCSRGM